jgi:hypothetical protein
LIFGNGYQFIFPNIGMQTLMKDLRTNSAAKHFALCESCFWSATILMIEEDGACPMCTNDSVSLIPLAADEKYRINFGPSAGLELSFSKRSTIHS